MSELWLPKGTMTTRRAPAGDKIHLDSDWILHRISPAPPAPTISTIQKVVVPPPIAKSSMTVPQGTVWMFPWIPLFWSWIKNVPFHLWNWLRSGFDELGSMQAQNARITQILRDAELSYVQANPGTMSSRRRFFSPWWLLILLIPLFWGLGNCAPVLGTQPPSATTQPTSVPTTMLTILVSTPAPVPSNTPIPTNLAPTATFPAFVSTRISVVEATQTAIVMFDSHLPHSGENTSLLPLLGLLGLMVIASGLFIQRFSR